jgi:hypothetical protein
MSAAGPDPAGSLWEMIESFYGKKNVLTRHKGIIAAFGGDEATTTLFEQLCFWQKKCADPDGWIYKTLAEWKKESLLSRYQVTRAAGKLIEMGLLERERRLCRNGTTPYHYRLKAEECRKFLGFDTSATGDHVRVSDTCMCESLTHALLIRCSSDMQF